MKRTSLRSSTQSAGKEHKTRRSLIRVIIALAQLNLHIWNKDIMEAHHASEPDRYMELLKLSHQLNGIRNRLRTTCWY